MTPHSGALTDRTLVIPGGSRGIGLVSAGGYDLSRHGGGSQPIPNLFIG
jgi:hypothetical protein